MLRNYVGYNPLFWPRLSHIEATIENWAYDEAACITGRVTSSVDPCPKEFRNCPMDTRLPISLFICKYITVCIIVINCVYWKSDFQNKSASAQFDDEFQSVLSFREPQLSCAMVYSYIYISSIAPPPSRRFRVARHDAIHRVWTGWETGTDRWCLALKPVSVFFFGSRKIPLQVLQMNKSGHLFSSCIPQGSNLESGCSTLCWSEILVQ